ncbi:MAG: hypothetical protein ABR78_03205 [Acidimicrobiia bacterium BACL6 MAG-120910-bin40]|nr:MAG: hypothetical protein ABR78_03205 [Acidimicrobiia bacterium BACL6 MAG-120910-bin40]
MKSRTIILFSFFALTACSGSIDSSVEKLNPDNYAVQMSTPEAPKILPAVIQQSIVIYLIAETGLRAESSIVASPISTQSVIDALTNRLDSKMLISGLRSSLTARADLIKSIEIVESTTIIDLDSNIDQIPGDEQLLMLGQIVLSILANTNSTSVMFTTLGNPLIVPNANGKLIDGNAVRSDYIDLLTK